MIFVLVIVFVPLSSLCITTFVITCNVMVNVLKPDRTDIWHYTLLSGIIYNVTRYK